jgi:xylulokinase
MSLLGIDLGTSGVKAGVFSVDGRCIAQGHREYDMLHPRPEWSELDSNEVWQKTKAVIAEVASKAGNDPVSALSVSSFGEAVVPVTRHREILDNSILCVDSRGQEHVDRLLTDFGHEAFYAINPNMLGPNYSMPKILWLREHRPGVYQQADLFLHWADFVAFILGADAVTNNSHANRTLLFDLNRNDWSDELVAWSGIDPGKFAPVVSAGTVSGIVSNHVAAELGLPKNVGVVAGGHDQCCNALGCGGVSPGQAVYGMGSFDCITPIYRKPADLEAMRLNNLNVEHHIVPDLFVSFHYNQAGLLIKWFRDTFADGTVSYEELDQEMPDEPSRLLVLPHFDPPPHHSPDTAGVIVGLKTTTTRGEILRAIQEGTTLFFLDGMDALKELGLGAAEYIASGGGARSDRGLQLRADILGIPVVRPANTEAGLLGSAMNAGISTGVFRSPTEAVERFVRFERRFVPDDNRHKAYREKHALYRQLYPSLERVLRNL